MHVARLRCVEFRMACPLERRCNQLRARASCRSTVQLACSKSFHKGCDKDPGDIDGRDLLKS